MARVPKMERGKISLADGIQCCSNLFYFFRPISGYILKNMCVYIHTRLRIDLYELTFLPNNTASETFLQKSGAIRSVDWIFIIKVPVWR
jgi:hypothetical protein